MKHHPQFNRVLHSEPASAHIIKQQAEALAFEQYLKHRDLFIKIMSDTVKTCPRKIEIYNVDELYKNIFPSNNPTARPSYSVEINNTQACTPRDLTSILAMYSILTDQIQSNSADCAHTLLRLMGMLKINCLDHPSNGDLIFNGNNTGINIYSIYLKTNETVKVINSILYFTGNSQVKYIDHFATSGLLTKALIEHFNNKAAPRDTFYAVKNEPWLQDLEKLYIRTYNDTDFQKIFKNTSIKLQLFFSTREKVITLSKNPDDIINCHLQEDTKIKNKKDISQREENCIKSASNTFNNIKKKLAITKGTS